MMEEFQTRFTDFEIMKNDIAWAWAGLGCPSSTLSKDVGSIRYRIASPVLATGPPYCHFQDTTPALAISLFPIFYLSCYSVQFLPVYFFPCPPHHIPLMSGDPPARPRGALKGQFPLTALVVLFPPG
jgi:hypothetical protein